MPNVAGALHNHKNPPHWQPWINKLLNSYFLNLIPNLSIECRIVTQYIARLAEQLASAPLTEHSPRIVKR